GGRTPVPRGFEIAGSVWRGGRPGEMVVARLGRPVAVAGRLQHRQSVRRGHHDPPRTVRVRSGGAAPQPGGDPAARHSRTPSEPQHRIHQGADDAPGAARESADGSLYRQRAAGRRHHRRPRRRRAIERRTACRHQRPAQDLAGGDRQPVRRVAPASQHRPDPAGAGRRIADALRRHDDPGPRSAVPACEAEPGTGGSSGGHAG
ncbi:hypothetical protein OY671_009569, partial [Metschnikowia pulcherrima]